MKNTIHTPTNNLALSENYFRPTKVKSSQYVNNKKIDKNNKNISTHKDAKIIHYEVSLNNRDNELNLTDLHSEHCISNDEHVLPDKKSVKDMGNFKLNEIMYFDCTESIINCDLSSFEDNINNSVLIPGYN